MDLFRSVTRPFSTRILEMVQKKKETETENVREGSKIIAHLIGLPLSVRLSSWNVRNEIKSPGVLPEKLGGGVRHAFWKPYPISDENLWFSRPYFRPDEKFDTLFHACLVISSLGQTNVKGKVYTLLLSRIQNCTQLKGKWSYRLMMKK